MILELRFQNLKASWIRMSDGKANELKYTQGRMQAKLEQSDF